MLFRIILKDDCLHFHFLKEDAEFFSDVLGDRYGLKKIHVSPNLDPIIDTIIKELKLFERESF